METTAKKATPKQTRRFSKRETLTAVQSKTGRRSLRMSLKDFLRIDPEIPGVKLEWNDGKIELEYTTKTEERKIIDRIVRKYNTTKGYAEGNSLLPEADVNLPSVETYRRPDAAYLTKQQIDDPENAPAAPSFLIEVISPSNSAGEVERKIDEYFRAGVEVVWVVYPNTKRLYIYTSPKHVQICSDEDICSAAPAVPELQLTVNEIFA